MKARHLFPIAAPRAPRPDDQLRAARKLLVTGNATREENRVAVRRLLRDAAKEPGRKR